MAADESGAREPDAHEPEAPQLGADQPGLQQPSTDQQIEVQIERLADSHGGERSPEEIARLARESAAELEDAPIQDFVPNLVYNDVKSKLVEQETPAEAAPEASPNKAAPQDESMPESS